MDIVYPQNYNWVDSADIPPSIANGGTGFRIAIPDWVNALEWISKNTPDNAVINSWWDYGYWITTLGNKTSLADNATINQTRISTIAKMCSCCPSGYRAETEESEGIQIPASTANCYPEGDGEAESRSGASERGCLGGYYKIWTEPRKWILGQMVRSFLQELLLNFN